MELEQAKLANILIACLKKGQRGPDEGLLVALSSQEWSNLLAFAAMQRITPLLWHSLRQKNLETLVPETAAVQLQSASRRNTLKNLRFNGELSCLLTALKTENIPLILLKGIVLSNNVYENIGLREMNDIDVLARLDDLERIAVILTGMGYRPMEPLDVNYAIQTAHHLPAFIKKGHPRIEIHWTITDPNKHYSIEPHGLWERAVPVQIVGHETRMLSPEDLLLHLCLHTSYGHSFTFGLRPFCDITEVIDHFDSALDWQTVVDRAGDQGWRRGVYLALRLAVELAGALVPPNIMEKLQPSDMSETILEAARNQVFTDKYFATSITTPLAQLLESRRFNDKIKVFRHNFFLSKVEIAKIYSVPLNSLKIYGCYLRRVVYLLQRYGHALKKYQKNDIPLKNLVERKNIIGTWLAQPVEVSGSPAQRYKR
jgi:hypothetical protein